MSPRIKQWIGEECVRESRISGGFAILLREFNEWLWKYEGVHSTPDEFKNLLAGEGFRVIPVCDTLLVLGLGLIEDWQSLIGDR
jgi:hypothetical protein